jgi:hypothetical protein
MRHASREKPSSGVGKFSPLRAGAAILGAHVATQRILENREKQLEFAAGRTPARHTLVVLNR